MSDSEAEHAQSRAGGYISPTAPSHTVGPFDNYNKRQVDRRRENIESVEPPTGIRTPGTLHEPNPKSIGIPFLTGESELQCQNRIQLSWGRSRDELQRR